MPYGKYFVGKQTFKISKNSAFVRYKKSIDHDILIHLIEYNHIKLASNNKILTPFESALWLESLKINFVNGELKITSSP